MLTKQEKYTMDLKDISKAIKGKLKKSFPDCKFSSSMQRYAGGQSLTLRLMSAPFDPFVENAERNGYAIKDHHQVNGFYIEESKILSNEGKIMFLWMKELIDYFNYDDSDSQTDYFDVNFYNHLEVGKWDKPFVRCGHV